MTVTADDLLSMSQTPGQRTEQGLRDNISIGIQYLEAWLGGNGAAAINNLMEDAATAEISRSQVWQWIFNGVTLDSGETVTPQLVERLVDEEFAALREKVGEQAWGGGHWDLSRRLFVESALSENFPDFLTLPAYQAVLELERS